MVPPPVSLYDNDGSFHDYSLAVKQISGFRIRNSKVRKINGSGMRKDAFFRTISRYSSVPEQKSFRKLTVQFDPVLSIGTGATDPEFNSVRFGT